MLRRIVCVGVVGAVFTGVVSHKNDYEINTIALVRISRAAAVAFDIGYCYQTQLYNKKLDNKSEEYKILLSEVHKIGAEKLLNLCKTNKGVYIKVGQHIGALDYLLPPEYVNTLKVLHKDAPANSIEQCFKTMKEELNEDPNQIFIEFDPEPLGTASLAQVHKAKLKDGTTVAVKIQHSFVKGKTDADLRSMEILVKIMERVFPDFSIQWLVDETKQNIYKELNFVEEGHNAEKIAKMFNHYSWLKVPKVFWKYTTERLLVMEYVYGGQVNDLDYIKKHNIDPYDLCTKLGELYSHMIFETGFVHSDPHPGNILVKKDAKDKDVTVYLLDHGLYANLTDDFRYNYSQFWLSIIECNHQNMKFHADNIGMKDNMYKALACIVSGRPWSVIQKGINKIRPDQKERDLVRDQLPAVLDQIVWCLQNINRQALLILKTNDLIRGIEFSLKTNEKMCGLMILTKCCLLSGYEQRWKQAHGFIEKFYIQVSRTCTIIKFYVAAIYLDVYVKIFSIFGAA